MKSGWSGLRGCLAALCVLLFSSSSALGQAVNATLLGTVTDASGAVVAGARVTTTEMKTGVVHSITTNDSGNYAFADLPPGQYAVAVEKQGFKKAVRSGVDVVVNTDTRVNLALEPGTINESVVVTAETPILQTDRADVGDKIDNRQVVDLPLGNNRNFQNLLNLVPGATRAHRVHSEFFNAQDSLSTEVNGQARLFNNLQIEGVDDNERAGLLQIYIPPAEAIQTVDVSTSNYTAEFGRAGGAVTNVILKSGTNAFHGAAYEFNRISALAAVPFFQNTSVTPKASTTYNYYGGNVGGPILRNKLFFFGDILRIDDSRGKFDNLTVPRDDFRGGNLNAGGSTIYDPYMTDPTDPTHATLLKDASGNPIPAAPGSRTPFPNNVIPMSRFSPLAVKILALVPHTDVPNPGLSSNYQQNTRFLKNTTAFDTKFDFNRKDNDRFAFRFSRAVQSLNDQPIFGLAGGPKGGGFQGTGTQHVQSGALNHTHVFSPSLIAETRVGVSHYRNIARNSDYGSKASDALGITGANLDAFTSGMTAIDVQGGFSSPMIGYSASLPWDRGETNINAVTNWTKIHRNHAFKWGVDVRRLRDDLVQAQTFGPRGVFRFGTSTTTNSTSAKPSRGNNFAAFLLDVPTEVGRDVSVVSGSWRETEFFSYGQDKWQPTSKLTLDLGLRWELYFPPTPQHSGGYSNYDPTTNTLVLAGIGGNPLNLGRDTFYHYFAPRFGLAYRFTDKFVLRGGFGISYEPFPNNQYAWNYPVRQANGTNQPTSLSLPQWPGGQIASMGFGFPPPAPAALPSTGIVSGVCQSPPVPGVACIGLNSQYNVVDKNFQQPYVQSWNLALERALPKNFVLDVAYVGNHGVDIPMDYDLNAAVAFGPFDFTQNPPKALNNCPVRPLCGLPGGPGFGRTANTDFLFKPTSSNYHALQTRFNHRAGGGLLLTTSYTFAKALAYRSNVGDGGGNDSGSPSFYLDFRRNYMVLSNNRTHTFVQSVVYELPFGKGKPLLHSGWANWVAGGWQVSTVMTITSGRPLDFSPDGSGLNASLNAPGSRQTPNQVGPFSVLGGIGPSPNGAWFDTSAFAQVTTPATAGNMSRFKFTGPRFFNLDAAMFKRFPVTERIGLEFRAEAFSATNTPHFDQPNADASNNVSFGHITGTIGGADGNRTVELGAKLTF